MTRSFQLFALGAVLAASSTVASATSLTTGGDVTATSLAYSATNTLASVSGTLTAGTFTGNYTEIVIQDADNIYNAQCAGGCLTFVLQITTNSSSTNGVEHVSTGDGGGPFAPPPTEGIGFQYYSDNVGYSSVTGGTAPEDVDMTDAGTIAFNFTGGAAVAPGGTSDYLVIETNASSFVDGNFSVIDSTTDTVQGFIPSPTTTAVTPEPNSLLLMGTGLLGAAGLLVLRRRHAGSLL